MKTTSPVPLSVDPKDRSRNGLFAPGDAGQVIADLRQDLLANKLDVKTVVSYFVRGATQFQDTLTDDKPAGDLAKTAEEIITNLFDGSLPVEDLPGLVKVLYFAGHQRLLAKHHLRFPAYNILDEYFVNVNSPWGPTVLPRPRVPNKTWSLFGKKIGLPIGVPASVLTGNHKWILYFAANGFNVLTYKTVRSRSHQPSEAPNWAFASSESEPWHVGEAPTGMVADPWDWVNPGNRSVTTTNSFGVPSPPPREWMADFANALEVISGDQLLIISVMGDDYDGVGGEAGRTALVDDFAATARLAQEAGAEFIELNLSCPNSLASSGEGVKPPVCYDVSLTQDIVRRVRESLDSGTQLIAKLSYLNEDELAPMIHAIAPYIDGVSGVNTLQVEVTRASGVETFPGRDKAGVSGIAIQEYAQDFVMRLARLRLEVGKYFEIIGMGGVTDVESFEALYALGANAVQTATGSFANPFLASECVSQVGQDLPETAPMIDEGLLEAIHGMLQEQLKTSPLPRELVLASLPLRIGQGEMIVEGMLETGLVQERDGILHAS